MHKGFSVGDYEPRRSSRAPVRPTSVYTASSSSEEDADSDDQYHTSSTSSEEEEVPTLDLSDEDLYAPTRNMRGGARLNYGDDSSSESESESDHAPPPVAPQEPGIDAILDSRDGTYLVKWTDRAHLHNTWETLEALEGVRGYRKLVNFMAKQSEREAARASGRREELEVLELDWEARRTRVAEYVKVDRVIAARAGPEYLVKWCRLPYDQCTWEGAGVLAADWQVKVDEFLERQRPRAVHSGGLVPDQQPSWVPSGLQLRDYQVVGLHWLARAFQSHVNTILADEMGLGKTIQSAVFLGALHRDLGVRGPSLVVVPLSTITAWTLELRKWAPFLNTVVYTGNKAARAVCREHEVFTADGRPKVDVLVTTYEMARMDRAHLAGLRYRCLVVDEAHRLKDDASALYKDLFALRTDARLLITGTPLQNSLKELWCLLHFIQPKKFSSLARFTDKYSGVAQGNSIKELHEAMAPHLLRRLKRDVEKSLPKKSDRILRVELSAMQRDYQRWIMTSNYRELNRGGTSRNSLNNVVMELQKCCNHPFLFQGAEEPADSPEATLAALVQSSGKMILLDKLLARLRQTGHRVLIFSQMVRMLDILSDYLYLRGYAHQRLDGTVGSEDRRHAMEHFNAPDSADFCFLLSTRAGGLGINLATADTVIIFDSDWNPQNDLQAEARAHRIGQTAPVNIYRLITRDSVEEQVLEAAKAKLVLDHLVIQRMDTSGGGPAPKSSAFDRKDLAKILEFSAAKLFQETDTPSAKPVAEMDIDEILARAEDNTPQDESNDTDDFLSVFKVANFSAPAPPTPAPAPSEVDPEFWAKTIPAHLVPIDQIMDPALLVGGPRATKKTVSYTDTDTAAAPKSKTKKPKAKPKVQVKHVYRALMQFGSTHRVLDKLPGSEDIIEGLVSPASGGEFRDFAFDASALATRLTELSALDKDVRDAAQDYRFTGRVPAPRKWKVPWGVVQDSALLLGVWKHGFGSWDALVKDPALGLTALAENKLVSSSQLATRAGMLLRKLVVVEPVPAKTKKRKPTTSSTPAPKKKKKWQAKEEVLDQCKMLLDRVGVDLKKLSLLCRTCALETKTGKLKKYLRAVGDEIGRVVLHTPQKDLERHLWYYLELVVDSRLGAGQLRDMYAAVVADPLAPDLLQFL